MTLSNPSIRLIALLALLFFPNSATRGAEALKRYYAHDAVHDSFGVIAPWYRRQNGQLGFRIDVAAQTLKRYPWISPDRCAIRVPEYLLSSFWKITPAGDITTMPLTDYTNGDRGQLAAYVLQTMPEYYRYSGDPMAIAHASMEADAFLQFAQTDEHHPWPRFPISVPVKGKPYGICDPRGFMQLDLAARVGYGMLRVYQLTGEPRYFEAAKHWGDVLAEKCRPTSGAAPWDRYANFDVIDTNWKDNKMTGGMVAILAMLDELVRLGYAPAPLVRARDAGRAYLSETLLPAWSVNDTWGRQYWDWACPVQVPNVTAWTALYMMDHKDQFPNWRIDCRNMLSLCMNRTCVSPDSMGGVYSGAWAYPESCGCCGLCLQAGPQLLSEAWARYGYEADSEWARELVRRQMILATYDCLETGRAEDNIHGGMVTNENWFEAAQLAPLEFALKVMRWLPEAFGPPHENHIVRSSGVVTRVSYDAACIEYETFDATAGCVDVLRLAFVPTAVKANGAPLCRAGALSENGYRIRKLSDGDCLVTIRHDGARQIRIEGSDPQSVTIDDADLSFAGDWTRESAESDCRGGIHRSARAGSSVRVSFTGNQVQITGRVGLSGGRADVFVDDVKDPAGIDCWCPHAMSRQVIFARHGLLNGRHEIRLETTGRGNPRSGGADVWVDAMEASSAEAPVEFGEGGGPRDAQRMIFGYTQRRDYRDSEGHDWRPGCEFVVRAGNGADSLGNAWWTRPSRADIANTSDAELYRFGIHATEFWVDATVGPGNYQVRLKFAAAAERKLDTGAHPLKVSINGKQVIERFDVKAEAGGADRALDRVLKDIAPVHGVIEIHFATSQRSAEGQQSRGEAFVQAIEITPTN